MTSGYQAVIDACVLVNFALRETLLRLAGPPLLYLPRWSHDIITETTRTLEQKLDYNSMQTTALVDKLHLHFEDAWVIGYESFIPAMLNHPKDRHVLAAAIKTGAQAIVTFNLKDFPEDVLEKWDIRAQHPDNFLLDQYHLAPDEVVRRVRVQASCVPGGLDRLFSIHEQTVPKFVDMIRQHTSYATPVLTVTSAIQ
jgi:hypothetical protein